MSRTRGGVDGILALDKPAGWTSHDVVARVRRVLGQRRVGHAGTLDPGATGLLVLCLGRATRLAEYLTAGEKAYEGIIRLGVRTTTDDLDGDVIEERPVPPLADGWLAEIAAALTGTIEQIPPAVSAVHVGGKRAYALARAGKPQRLEAREIHVAELRLTLVDERTIAISVICGPGTYVRSLARDIGEALGCGGALAELHRTRSGGLTLDDAVTLARFEELAGAGRAAEAIRPPDEAMLSHPAAIVSTERAASVAHGQAIAVAPPPAGPADVVRLYDAEGSFVGAARLEAEGILRARKILRPPGEATA